MSTAPFPKSDPTARLVLTYLAEKASKDGRSAFPLAISIAYDLDLNPDVVPRVLKRLCVYGLISRDGKGPQGQPKWSLHLGNQSRSESLEEFCDRHRTMRSERQYRWREKGTVDGPRSSTPARAGSLVDDPASSTVDDPQSSTRLDVDDSESSTRRSSVVSETTTNRHVDDSKYPQNHHYNHHNHPENHHADPADRLARAEPTNGIGLDLIDEPPSKPTKAATSGMYTAAFEDFWKAYGRRGSKPAAFTEWKKAINRVDAETILAAVPAYVASTPEMRYRKHAERWLKGDGWESVPASPTSTTRAGHTPYRDPTDHSVYDEKI